MPKIYVVCGSRDWCHEDIIIDRLKRIPKGTVILTGGAPGADRMAWQWARRNGYIAPVLEADWEFHDLKAGPIRNGQMLDMEPEYVIAFRMDGKSAGTDNCLRQARDRGIPFEIIRPDYFGQVEPNSVRAETK